MKELEETCIKWMEKTTEKWMFVFPHLTGKNNTNYNLDLRANLLEYHQVNRKESTFWESPDSSVGRASDF